MRVITLAGSPHFPSRSGALLEYAREKLNGRDVDVYHWDLHNFAPEDLIHARFDSPALKTFIGQLQDADGLIVATPVYKAAYSGALKTLLDLLPERALDALTRLEMQDLIVSLWQQQGFTVLLVTHDVSEAVAMAVSRTAD